MRGYQLRHLSKNSKTYLFAGLFALVGAFAGATFAGALTVVFAGVATFASAGCETFAFAVFASAVFAFKLVIGGCVTGESGLAFKTELPPCNAGIAINRAESIKTVAATIVIFDKIVCVPRGPSAPLEILLVKSAPASVLPGCKSTEKINAIQDVKNNA